METALAAVVKQASNFIVWICIGNVVGLEQILWQRVKRLWIPFARSDSDTATAELSVKALASWYDTIPSQSDGQRGNLA